MAITLKPVILKHQKRGDGTFNVKIRVTLNRKIGYIPTEHYVGVKQLSKDLKEIKDNFINDELTLELVRLRKEISKLGAKVNNYDVKQLGEYLQEKRNPNNAGNGIDFIEFGLSKIEEMKAEGRDSSAANYQGAINNLKEFIKRDSIDIKEITVRFLRQYETFLRTREGMGSRGLEVNLIVIRALFNFAREEYNDEDMEDIRISHYPFSKYKIPKSDIPEKRSLDIYKILSIMSYEYTIPKFATILEVSRPELARDVYTLSFLLVGMNSADLYHIEKIDKGGRITYNRQKTKDRRQDKAEISIKIPAEALPLIKKYKDPTGKRVFNFYQRYSTHKTFNSNLNKGLKTIGDAVNIDNLDFYSARHSWATIARNDCDVSVDDISLALNHSSISSSRVTDRYIRKDWTRIDDANDKVLGFMNSSKEKKEIIGSIIVMLLSKSKI